MSYNAMLEEFQAASQNLTQLWEVGVKNIHGYWKLQLSTNTDDMDIYFQQGQRTKNWKTHFQF